ncbi:MAG TPA: single-stranded DNA-binding protein [Blastocatellia bacterium]|nr:single-stranded DNA-binding protein [Blastocatellia bacterium]
MASFNKITIVGYLGRDPELRYTPQGTAVCSFSVATTEKRKDKTGEAQEQTTWFRVTLWGQQAEVAGQYLHKGRQVYVEGRLRQEEYTDREGNKRTALEVNATELHFLDSNKSADQSEGQSMAAKAVAKAGPKVQAGPPPAPDDADIPF